MKLSDDDIAEILQALAKMQEKALAGVEAEANTALAWYFAGRLQMASDAAFLIRKKLNDNTEKNSEA